ncbi:MAG: prepilin-type N-terminal cleavage/methylation domain-containing protein [Chthoniobacterales bacterium]|nr:prepilin-type N-terminal cleavage/methylation domain-containing protein [Chthoniobacterales bacterium]
MKRLAGFSLPELLAAVAVAGLLASLGIAAVGRSIDRVNSAKCLSHLRQWGGALQCYIQESGGFLPRRGQGVQPVWVVDRPDDWFNSLAAYLEMPAYHDLYKAGKAPKPGARSVFVCPAARVTNSYTHFISYGMNMYLSRWDQPERSRVVQLPSPATLAFLADSPGGYASTVPSSRPFSVMPRHGGRANVAFVDGHVGSFPGDYLGCGSGEVAQPDIRWQPGLAGDTWRPVF